MPFGGMVGRGSRWLPAGVAAMALAFGGPATVHGEAGTPAPCARRVMQVVAHTDDDLLFMNPDVQHDIDAGHCVRTVYLTAGDGGRDARYWQRREAGVGAAYATMAAVANRWSTVPGTTVVRTLGANPNVSLVFLRLPDGAVRGDGFDRHDHAGLQKLWEGEIERVTSVDAVATYSKASLVAALSALMAEFRPDTVRVQDAAGAFDPHDDHSDHRAAARFAMAARATYAAPHDVVSYAGYVTQHSPANVTGDDLRDKKAAFYAYARYDDRACRSDRDCTGKYALWLRRQYTVG